MNPYVSTEDGSFHYYDSDYPWVEELRENPLLYGTAARQFIVDDVAFYQGLVAEYGADTVLEIACGTGRVAIPLARAGATVHGIDAVAPMLAGLRRRLAAEPPAVQDRVVAVQQNVLDLDLGRRDYPLAIWAFNGLMLVADFDSQITALRRIAGHLAPGGRLALDVYNPLMMPMATQSMPEVSFTRVNRATGNPYSKFALVGQMDGNQVQHLYGWYDEVMPDGTVRRTPYGFDWRFVFRYELELMLAGAGLHLEMLDGGFRGEAFSVVSPKIVAVARKA